MVLIALVIPALLGFLIATVLLRNSGEAGPTPFERMCMAFPLGMGLLTVQMFLMGLMRMPLTLLTVTLPAVLGIAGLILWIRFRKIPVLGQSSPGLYREIAAPGTAWVKKAVMIVLILWIGVKIGSVFLETWVRPLYGWDAWTNWSARAKAFYYARGLMFDAAGDLFYGGTPVNSFRSYPPHNPLTQMWLSLWAGEFSETLVKFSNPVYFMSIGLLLYGIASRRMNRLVGLAFAVIFFGSSFVSYHGVEAYSDLALSACLLGALASFLYAMEGSNGAWGLLGLFSALALFTKNETPGYIGPLLLSAAVYLWMQRKSIHLGKSLAAVFVPLLLCAPWFLVKKLYSLSVIHDGAAFTASTYFPDTIGHVIGNFLSLENFNIMIVAFPVLLVLAGKPGRQFLHLLFPVAVYAALYVIVYATQPYFHSVLLMGTVFSRNVLTYYPSICLLTILLLTQLMQQTAPASPVPVPKPAPRKRKAARTK